MWMFQVSLCFILGIFWGEAFGHYGQQDISFRRDGYWPCRWTGIPLYVETDSFFFTKHPKVGEFTIVSRPPGDQTSPSEILERRGPFFLLREFNQYHCMYAEQYSETDFLVYNTDWYNDIGDSTFCDICDIKKFTIGPKYGSTFIQLLNSPQKTPWKCTVPPGCPRRSWIDVRCPSRVPRLDSGRSCLHK